MAQKWQSSQYSALARQIDISCTIARLGLSWGLGKLSGSNSPRQKRNSAERLANSLVDLGPTFIKIGQALSTRGDILPLEYVEALGQLQDQVPEFGGDKAIAIVEAELGNSIHSLFRDFDKSPLAAASLGQVHKARLHTGEDVVVKVQRPGLDKLFNLDFEVLHLWLRRANCFVPGIRKYELEAIYQEFFELLYQEIDYVHEGKNAERFRENFRGNSRVVVPQVFWRYTTKKVLTLEYVPGIKIDDRQTLENCGINTNEVIQLGICAYLKQLLLDGFFQSDPHPGNMAVSKDGKLIFYDFGTMAEVKSMAQDHMVKTFFAVVKKDTDEVVDTLTYMGLIEPVPNMTPVRRLVEFLLEKFTEKPVDLQAFGEIKEEIYLMFQQQPFRLPPQMTFIIKAVSTLDGIARALNPQYNLMAASEPFIKTITVAGNKKNLVGELARQTKDFVSYKLKQPNKTELLIRSLEARIEEAELRLRMSSQASDRTLKRINLAIKSLTYACLSGFTLVSGTLLVGSYPSWAIVIFIVSGVWCLLLLRSLITLAIKERLDRLG